MVAAYYLSKYGYSVTVYEKQAALGGNIRTLNRNVNVENLDPSVVLEGGVVEFSSKFTHFLALMEELDIELEPLKVGSALFHRDAKRYLSPTVVAGNTHGFVSLLELLKVASVYLSATWLWLRVNFKPSSQFHDKPFADYVKEKRVKNTWLKLLTMYCYSIPYKQITKVPAELAIYILRNYMWADWKRIKGGVYRYIEKIESTLKGEVVLNANISCITRNNEGVTVSLTDNKEEHFDKLVFAVPPDQVLKLLSDPTEEELRYFGPWRENLAKTVVHCDPLIYKRYGIRKPSEFDFFQTEDGWGYNACLNRICGLPAEHQYNLAYNIDCLIAEENIIQTFEHHTPLYTVDALHYRNDVIRNNGKNHTYHAGAYLYDGLHEGAVISGKRVAELIRRSVSINPEISTD